jgi:hypothetical protein
MNPRTGREGLASQRDGEPPLPHDRQRSVIAEDETMSSPRDLMTLSEFLRVAAPMVLPPGVLWLSSYVLLLAVAQRLDAVELGAAATSVVLFLIIDAGIAEFGRRPLPMELGLLTFALVVALPVASVVFHVGLSRLWLLLPVGLAAGVRSRSTGGPGYGRRSLVVSALGGAVRVLAGIVLVGSGLGVTGILLALLVGEVAVLALDRQLRPSRRTREELAARDAFVVPVRSRIVAGITLAVFVHADILLAQHLLSRGVAGGYAGAGVVARSILFASAVATLALRDAVAPIRSPDPFRWLREWMATATTGVIVVGVVLVLFRDAVIRSFLGAPAPLAANAFPFIVAGICLVTVVSQLSYFHWVVDSRAYILTMAGVLLEILLVAPFPATDERIAVALVLAAGLTALLMYEASWAITRWSPPLRLLRSHEEIATGVPAKEDLVEEVELSIIVPCHNTGPGLRAFLARLEAELRAADSYEIIVVSDGSTDETLATARELASPTLRVVHYPDRSGKGHALRVGFSRARGRYIGFIDSDGDIDPQAIGPFLTLMRTYQPDIVLGSKRHPMSQVAYPALRRIMSWVYHKLTRLLFRVNVRDTQTGLKVVRQDVLTAVLPRMFEKRFAWDLELLVVARTLGFTNVFEAPVRIEYQFSSQVDTNAVFRIILDSMAIFYRRYILNSYRHTADRLAVIRDPQARA